MSLYLLLGFLLLLDYLWWRRSDRAFRGAAFSPAWRIGLGIFMLGQVVFLISMGMNPDSVRASGGWMPKPLVIAAYLWHLIILLVSLLAVCGVDAIGSLVKWIKRRRASGSAQTPSLEAAASQTSRRQFLTTAAFATPPLLTMGLTGVAMRQIDEFRVRPFDLNIPDLPRDLDGLTIAHVTDVHVGTYTEPAMLPAIVSATNNLRADLVLFTGDLINLSLHDLTPGLDMLRQLQGKYGLYACEGNHDLLEDPIAFRTRFRASGIPLLIDQSRTLRVRGHPVQLLGLSWSNWKLGMDLSMDRLRAQREADAFPILLAHHPHAFDLAVKEQIPLVLSGHTHGGQLMLTPNLGAGSIMFKYWTGLYQRNNSSMLVSNGIGNWFPLRINAPAEILHVTLHRAG